MAANSRSRSQAGIGACATASRAIWSGSGVAGKVRNPVGPAVGLELATSLHNPSTETRYGCPIGHHRRTCLGLFAGRGWLCGWQPDSRRRTQPAGAGPIRRPHRDGALLCQLPGHRRRSASARCPSNRHRRGPCRNLDRFAARLSGRQSHGQTGQAGIRPAGRGHRAMRGGLASVACRRRSSPVNRRWLVPFKPLYALGLALRNLRIEKGWEPVKRLRFPVVSIGNLSPGGSGKTSLTIALAKALTNRGLQVDVLSRGYGRQSRLAARVRPEGTAEEFGDEPLLIAREANVPVYVAPQRYEAGLLAESAPVVAEYPIVHLLDDGFQHRQLFRDVDILLIGCRDWRRHVASGGELA